MTARSILAASALLTVATPLAAAENEVPYWASLRAPVVNMRVGPGEDYRINWIYRREHLPLKVLRTMEGWRLVEDPDGARGWMLARFLTRERSAFVKSGPPAEMHDRPDPESRVLWHVAPGVSGKLGGCSDGWCRFDVDGRAGFIAQRYLWGAGEP
ncbi:MAG: hypothetical protein JF593_09365 [Novosphingobium sp.]|nr:hypothetical protein [Novosphingobium sp.]